jgi:hypothetical protein
MKAITPLICLSLLACVARATPPTPESVEKMLELTGVQKLNASVIGQLDGMTKNIISRTFQGQALPPQAKQLEDAAQQRLQAIVQEDLGWEMMKPVYIQIYTASFSQEDVDGVIAFYQGKAEQDYAAKMPQVTRETYGQIQQRIGRIMGRMQASMKETTAQVRALKAAAAPVAPPVPPAPAAPAKAQ